MIACTEDTGKKDNSSKTLPSKHSERNGTKMMNDSISNILKYASAEESIYENKIRAELYKNKFSQSKSGSDLFNYVKEMLNNGDTDNAITEVQNLLKNNPNLVAVNQQTKIFHEILAICYLRKGEQENCQDNHNDESCIIPIAKNGQHNKKQGSEKAIEKYTQLLNVFPDDTQSLWLLNIAYMTLGKYPSEVPKKYLVPIGEKSSKSTLNNIATQMGVDFFGLAGGSISDDFNNDGFYDIVTSSWGSQGKMKYYENDGKGSFIDKTSQSQIGESKGGLHINQTDYNNDGFLDVFILRSAWMPNQNWGVLPNSLLKNNGDGTFTDVTIEAGLYAANPTQAATWNDFNNDGHIDLFVANETTHSSKKDFQCEFYLNNGDGTFSSLADKYKLNKVGYFKGCTSGDVNNDGWPDLYLSNLNGENLLLIGKHESMSFTGFKQVEAGVEKPTESFPCWFFDIDNDGWEDLYVASYDRTAFEDQGGQFASNIMGKPIRAENSCLYKNTGDGAFTNVTNLYIKDKGTSTMGCNFGDINNDGFPDFYLGTGAPDYRAVVPNRLYINQAGKKFDDQTFSMGVGHIQKGHGISFADFDNDGDQDIYAVMGGAFKGDGFPNAFYENSDNSHQWIKIKLEGVQSNRPGIGARIKVVGKSKNGLIKTIYKTVGSGSSFGANPLTSEIGLGDMTTITSLSIKWPNGKNEFTEYKGLDTNKKYVIKEGQEPIKSQLVSTVFKKNAAAGGHHHHH